MSTTEQQGGGIMFKKAGRSAQKYSRQRVDIKRQKGNASLSEHGYTDEDEEQGQTAILTRHKPKRLNPMIQSTSKIKQQRRRESSVGTSSEDDDGEASERSKALDIDHQYQSTKCSERSGPTDMGATWLNEAETDFCKDSRAQLERVQCQVRQVKQSAVLEGNDADKVYKGLAFYGATEKKDTVVSSAAFGKGPIRAPQFLRQTVRWDYAPDLCKDYKETGFCTFGDSCKFLHDRTDYKHGWEIERDYQKGKLKEQEDSQFELSDKDSDDDDLPFKCFICRQSFVNPVVTKCKHYFCEKCALELFKKTKKCYVCEQNTQGVFNPAKELVIRLEKAEKRKPENYSNINQKKMCEKEDAHDLVEDTKIEMLSDNDNKEDDNDNN